MNLKKIKFCPVCGAKLISTQTKATDLSRPTCSHCQFVFYQNPTPTVIGIIKKNSQLLLIKRNHSPYRNFWSFPGGFVELTQNLELALQAELQEELQATIKSTTYFGSYVSQYKLQGIVEAIVATAFEVKLTNYDFKLNNEIIAADFFALDKLPKLAPFLDVQAIIKQLKKPL